MKFTKTKMLAVLGAVLAMASSASAQLTPDDFFSATNLPATTTGNSISNNLSSVIPIRQGYGLGLSWTFNVSSNAATQPVGIILNPIVDRTNILKNISYPVVANATGQTNLVIGTNFSAAFLQGFTGLNITQMTNGTSGVLTNMGTIANRRF